MSGTKTKVSSSFLDSVQEEFIKLYLVDKLDLKQIAYKYNCSEATVYNRLKSLNVEFRHIREPWNKGNKTKYFCLDCNKEVTRKKSKRCVDCCSEWKSKNLIFTDTQRQKMSISAIKRLQNPIERARLARVSRLSRNPFNKSEQKLADILDSLFPNEYRFVGNGDFFVKQYNPDFISKNKIIELYGEYWHGTEEAIKRDFDRLKTYNELGYKTLIIYWSELKNIDKLKQKLLSFNK